jgi:hypothetical protein
MAWKRCHSTCAGLEAEEEHAEGLIDGIGAGGGALVGGGFDVRGDIDPAGFGGDLLSASDPVRGIEEDGDIPVHDPGAESSSTARAAIRQPLKMPKTDDCRSSMMMAPSDPWRWSGRPRFRSQFC